MFLNITGTPALGTQLMHDTPDSIKSNSGENQIVPTLETIAIIFHNGNHFKEMIADRARPKGPGPGPKGPGPKAMA